MTIRRFSSRTERLDTEFLAKSLKGATKYSMKMKTRLILLNTFYRK